MKLCLILLILPMLSEAFPAAATNADDKTTITLDDEVDNEHASSDKESAIQKRSGGGSFSYVTQIKSGILSSLGHASASIASGSSSSSSGYKSIDGHHGNSVEYDPWSFKKSLLSTIFQAVKAITGGVTALKGQLIKGSGYALSASGNVVTVGGDKVTDVGKAIINAAHQNSPTYGPPSHGDAGFVHPLTKFSSLSGASSSSHGGASKPGGVIHTETITSYEIPAGHGNYGPPTKPPTYSSATHQYLPPGGGYGGGAPFSSGHAAFEAPSNNYLPSSYDGYYYV